MRNEMKTLRLVIAAIAVLSSTMAVGQQNQQTTYALDFAKWSVSSQSPNTYTFSSPSICQFPNPYNSTWFTFARNTPVLIADNAIPSNSEVVTPSSVYQAPCGFSA